MGVLERRVLRNLTACRIWPTPPGFGRLRSSQFAALMASILASHLFLKTPWRRLVFVAFVIPLGILRNGFRIFVIGLLCVKEDPQMIHSLIHRRGGPSFFLLSLIPFLLLVWWLRNGETRTRLVESFRVSSRGKPLTSCNLAPMDLVDF